MSPAPSTSRRRIAWFLAALLPLGWILVACQISHQHEVGFSGGGQTCSGSGGAWCQVPIGSGNAIRIEAEGIYFMLVSEAGTLPPPTLRWHNPRLSYVDVDGVERSIEGWPHDSPVGRITFQYPRLPKSGTDILVSGVMEGEQEKRIPPIRYEVRDYYVPTVRYGGH
jgi:hypothetical protein